MSIEIINKKLTEMINEISKENEYLKLKIKGLERDCKQMRDCYDEERKRSDYYFARYKAIKDCIHVIKDEEFVPDAYEEYHEE